MDKLTYTAQKQRHPRKPILYWIAVSKLTGHQIDQNNSISIVRSRTDQRTCHYQAIR